MADRGDMTIRPATIADADGIAKAHTEALERFHDFYSLFFKEDPRSIIPRNTRKVLRDPAINFTVAVVASAENGGAEVVAGFIRWAQEEPSEQEQQTETLPPAPFGTDTSGINEPNLQEAGQLPLFAVKTHMEELWNEFRQPREDEMDACYEQAAEGRKHLCK
jgi:hypothetical protein